MNHLENFIEENRAAFDNATPDLRVWATLNQRLDETALIQQIAPQAKIIRMPIFANKLRIAASVAGLVLSGIAIGFFIKSNQTNTSLSTVSPEYGEIERYYQQQIEKKTKQLASLKNADEVKADLSQIDAVMEELRGELTNAPKGSREQIIKNMVTSYKNKVDILERVIAQNSNYNNFVQSNNNIKKNEKDTI
jgi:hypothetical protein